MIIIRLSSLAKMKTALLSVYFSLALLAGVSSQTCNSTGSVRLVWGSGSWEGLVQICLNGVWGWVCHNGFSNADAQVVCRQVGYGSSGAVARTSSYFGWGNGVTWIDYVGCTGSETTITSCSYSTSLTSSCNIASIAGVVCQSGGTGCTNNAVRLIPSSQSSYRSYGRVEVCINKQWGTVCDDGWNYYDARTFCRQLGYYDGGSSCCASYGRGYVPIAIRYVSCSSSHTTFSQCSYTSGSSGCSASEIAGATCYGRLTTSCSSGQVRLWRPSDNGPTNEGVALYCRSGTWRGICNYNFNCHTARVICLQSGYPGALGIRTFYNYGYYNYFDDYTISCYSSSTTIGSCNRYRPGYYYYTYYGYRFRAYCTSSTQIYGVVCYAPGQSNICTNGTVRLVNGTTSNEGRAEYCYEGDWVPFCGMSSLTASRVCNELGYNYTYGSVIEDERFGRLNKLTSFNHKYCSSSHQSLSDCIDVRKGSSCYITLSRCPVEYGLRCYNPGSCVQDGDLRLVNGTIQQEGRAEICLNGVWGAICETGWTSNDAVVFCRELGYNGPGPTTYYDAYFGETYGPVIFSNMACFGWENTISYCGKTSIPNFNCTQHNTAGVTCKDSCTSGAVKLVGGKYSNEGTVLVCYNNLWGLISDTAWSNGDARVVCRSLGHSDGIAKPILGSQYGKPNLVVHFRDVSCFGQEMDITQCSKTTLSFTNGKSALATDDVAGVDCIYDEPSDCIPTPDWVSTPGSMCNPQDVRLQGSSVAGTGRLEYCYNGRWSPFCNLDPITASVACKQIGFTNYTAASIIPTTVFGVVQNFSSFQNITCNGTESTLSQCTVHTSECTPWCPHTNIAIQCFNPGTCTEGEVRLVDGIIENEGRIEICYNRVWGAVCDQGWDKTDAHVACTQLGYSEREPVVFPNSSFGAGIFPIVFSNFACGGWETDLADCSRQVYPQSTCSRNHAAGVLCGYDCNDGDTRLVGSQYSYEGTVEICFDHIWGLISDSGWSIQDAEVVCRQLGYETEGTISYDSSYFGKPNKTIHLANVTCNGLEDTLNDCTRTTISLQAGKDMIETTNVAGVRCYIPDHCVVPPPAGDFCTHGQIRLTGGRPMYAEGNLEYCYHGSWSLFCYLGAQEAVVACRQLGYSKYDITTVFDDGRFGLSTVSSLFQNFSCSNAPTATSLSECDLIDSCRSTCSYPISLRCYEPTDCQDGNVRLVNGTSGVSGRLEVCRDKIWGGVCGTSFDQNDAYVVCRELTFGISDPYIYTDSHFGDGNGIILYSNFQCTGYEGSLIDCPKQQYGTFNCPRNAVVGIVCRDDCQDYDVRLVGGDTPYEGTVEVCNYHSWGQVLDRGWGNKEAQAICNQLGYNNSEAVGFVGSYYGKANRHIQLVDVVCNGTEFNIGLCNSVLLSPEEIARYNRSHVAGVDCRPVNETPSESPTSASCGVLPTSGSEASTPCHWLCSSIVFVITIIILIVSVSLNLSCAFCLVLLKRKYSKKKERYGPQARMTLSTLQTSKGVENPIAAVHEDNPYEFEGNGYDEEVADYEELQKYEKMDKKMLLK